MQPNGHDPVNGAPGSPAAAKDLAPPAPLRLGAVLSRLEQIRRELDRDDLDLEDQLVLYREGCELAGQAKRILENTRAEVEILMEEANSDGVRGAGTD